MRTTVALLDLLVPGAGHVVAGRRRAGLLFLVPLLVASGAVSWTLLTGGVIGLLAFIVTPGVLPALAIVNVLLAGWRIAAAVDIGRGAPRTRRSSGVLAVAILVLVIVPHAVAGQYIASVSDFLDSTFASGPDNGSPDASALAEVTDPPDQTDPPSVAPTDDSATDSPAPSGSRVPATPRPPMTSGVGTLPPLGAAVPWTPPGAVPWGDDGRFDLLLLGSDAGTDRWSRRMDVMLLVEIDVATGRVAMIGIPRNIQNAPFPAGAARDAVACGCFSDLLNSLYVEATVRHPSRWPGTGAVSGIGAVRATVSELTGRPVDAVLVADLWGVIKVVNAMGGIDINVPAPVHDDHYPDPVYGDIVLDIPSGRQHMDGRIALAYARSRHQDSDYARMVRQQTLLLAIRAQLGAAMILRAPSLFTAAKGFAWTDLPRSSLPSLVELFGRAASAPVNQLRIVPPRYPAVLTPDEVATIRADIASMLGTVAPPSPSPSPSAPAAPSGSPPPSEPVSPSPSQGPPSPAPTASPTATPTPSAPASPSGSTSPSDAPPSASTTN